MKFKSLKGILDVCPPDIFIWHKIEDISRGIFKNHGFSEIRLPIIESTDIFTRSIGETSDIVEKEMYTFTDKGGRSVTLRPEGTAPFIRAYVEHHLYNEPAPQKYYYMGPMFRYERPQAGRQRQFYQIGAEALGVEDPKVDAEIIAMLSQILEGIGLKNLNFQVNSIGCAQCRPSYIAALRDYLQGKLESFCVDCKRRFDTNPLRILDCKVPACIKEREGSPAVIGHLCEGCNEHFNDLKHYLQLLNVPHTINPNLIRGLDYYTKTAFEVTSESLGSQNAVAAGGRYDGLVKEFGGPSTPGIGFAIGMDRIIPLIKDSMDAHEGPDVFICTLGRKEAEAALVLADQLRKEGKWIEINYEQASIRSQMNKANRIKAKNVIVLGEDELKSNTAELKVMDSGEKSKVSLDVHSIIQALKK
ncbi:MAG: histidine--tRNA ligase [Thermodesulfovibrionia bacterium]|nr:histidine--tRNA ligase [Thermodesulfovibrionia bacterium]